MTTINTELQTIIAPSQRLGNVEEYYFSKKLREIAQMRAAGHHILNLGIGSPDLAPHPSVVERLHEASGNHSNHAYQSYTGLPELRTAFAGWYQRFFSTNLDPNREILPLIGSKEGIMHISMAFLNPGDEVLVPNPGYPSYRSATELAGGRVRYYELSDTKGWFPDLAQLEASDLNKVKIMWVNYPHMPTGTAARADFFTELVRFAKQNQILLVNDNPYAFILNDNPFSLLSIPGAKEVALELNSLSKAHNMAGWRVGMVGGAEPYIQTILRFKSNMDSGMFKPVQLAAVTALGLPQTWYEELNSVYRKRRKVAFELLDQLGCQYDRHQVGLFTWAKTPAHYASGFALSDQMLYDHHVFLTPGGIFGSQGDNYIRISLCSPVETLREASQRIAEGKK